MGPKERSIERLREAFDRRPWRKQRAPAHKPARFSFCPARESDVGQGEIHAPGEQEAPNSREPVGFLQVALPSEGRRTSMQEANGGRETGEDRQEAEQDENSRPQKAGEAGTTRFGMEDGDNNDIPATGDGTREEGGGQAAG